MSWDIFKQNILRYSNNPDTLKDTDKVAEIWTTEYDAAVKRGYDSVNFIAVKTGNVELMKPLLKLALDKGLSSKQPYDLVGAMGDAVRAYWTGAVLNEFPIPIIPAPGSVSNISVVSNVVTNTGVWTPQIVLPIDISEIEFSDAQLATSVLASLEGLSISEANAVALSSTTSPGISSTAANLRLKLSLDPAPIPNPTSTDIQREIENTPDLDQPTIVSNYRSNIKVPEDIILAMRKYGIGINNPLERAHFLSQCAHESGTFTQSVENLNYRESTINQLFPKNTNNPGPHRFTPQQAKEYANKPERIANKLYGRTTLGNGPENSGDGWRYRGRGYIQLTGKANYINAEKFIKGGIVQNPDKVGSVYKADTACYFWIKNELGKLITGNVDETIKILTKRINGGQIGLDDRKLKFFKFFNELQKNSTLWA
jgi:putative chitinase